jgi:hypothetical protein
MTDLDLELRADLDRRYPPLEGAPDWAAVLARAGTAVPHAARDRPPSTHHRHPSRRPLLLGAGAAITIAVALMLVVPLSRNGAGFGQKALAAIGSGRYIHAEMRPITSPAATIDLATGRVEPITERVEMAYDTRTGTAFGSTTFAGVVFGGGSPSDPIVRTFAGGYQRALASGAARVVRRATVDGVDAQVIRFATTSFDGITAQEDVAVSETTHKPIRIRYASVDAHGTAYPGAMTFRVVRFGSSDSKPVLPRPSAGFEHLGDTPALTGNASDIRDVSIGEASHALGHAAVWPGEHLAGTTLRRARLQFVTTMLVAGFRTTSHATGLRLEYRKGTRELVVEQAASALMGYDFWSRVYGTSGPLPPQGAAIMTCNLCSTASRHDRVWQAQLRRDGLFITIRSSERSLVIAAARSLVRTPAR